MNNLGRIYELMGSYRLAFQAYEKVANDPNAPPALRAIDAARASKLESKLGKAYLRVYLTPVDSVYYIAGKRAAGVALETVVNPGRVFLQVLSRDERTGYLVTAKAKRDHRRDLKLSRETLQKTMTASVSLKNIVFKALWIGDQKVVMGRLERVALAPGKYTFRAQVDMGKPVTFTATLVSGKTRLLEPLITQALRARAALGTPAPKAISTAPLITAGTGGAIAVLGAVFLVLANSDRATVNGAATDERGVVTGLTLAEASELEQRANTRQTAGATLVGLGGTAIVTGILWYLFAKLRPTRTETPVTRKAGGFTPSASGFALHF